MNNSLSRVVAIVRADFLVRFRRPSTLVVFLLLSAFAYLWIPAPSSGRALLQVNGHRALYNSGAIGMATASIAMIFVGLFGFYVISNAVRRDIVTRCGVVAASTPMRTIEYLLGKFLGNVAFLSTFTAGFMLSSMATLAIRAEAPMEPLVFVRQYLLLTPAAITFVSALAVLFESIRWLSGKFGDAIYFFLWVTSLGVVASQEAGKGGIRWGRYVDFTGFGFMIGQTQRNLGVTSVSIGSTPVDPSLPPAVFPGLNLPAEWLWPRIISILLPLALLPVAGLFFHRFDPVLTRRAADKGKRNWLGRIQMLFKPLSRSVVDFLMRPAREIVSLFDLGRCHAYATLSPFALLAILIAALVTLVAPGESLSIIFAALAILVADVVTRDARAATTAIIHAAPRLRENLVWWKFGSAFLLALLLCAVPLLRNVANGPLRSVTLLVGIFFTAAMATSLGVLAGNSKAFIAAFLSFWYVVVNDRGASPLLDFAGFYGASSRRSILLYFILSITGLVGAEIFYRARLRRS